MTCALLILLSLHAILADTRLAQDTIGCFYHFHELPSISSIWNPKNLSPLILPESQSIPDLDLCAIIPYFTDQDADFNWHTQEIKPDPSTNVLCEPVNSFLLLNQVKFLLECWRTVSCYDAAQELLREEQA